MSVGFGLIKSVVDGNASLSSLTEAGITDSSFIGDERKAFKFVRDYFLEYGTYPQLDTISIEISSPSCFRGLPDEPHVFWVDRVLERLRHNIAHSGLKSIKALLEGGNTSEAIDGFGNCYTRLKDTFIEFRAIDLKDAETRVLDKHSEVQKSLRIPGIPFGFPYIDAMSGGAQRGDSIIIAGVTGSGKTFLSLKVALTAFYAGFSVLYLCTEMPEEQISRRLLAMECNFDTTHLKLGRLSAFGVNKAVRIINSPLVIDGEAQQNFFKILPGGLYSSFEDIHLMVRETRPDLLVIDGASLVRLPYFKGNRWERMIEVMERVKNLAMHEDIASLSTYHFNKQAPGTVEGMYGGLAMGQLASMVFAFEFERAEDRESPNPVQYRLLKLLKGRDGESGTIRVLYNMLRSAITQDRVIAGYAAIGEDELEETAYLDDEPYVEI